MIKELKLKIAEELENYMLKYLVNHRKKKEGLISVQNELINDVLRFLDDWKQTEVSYLDLRIRYNGFENLTKHNNDFKKVCSKCDGKGEVKSATKSIDGYDLEECLDCNGQGFIKS